MGLDTLGEEEDEGKGKRRREKMFFGSPRHHRELSTYFRERSIGGCGKE
jgi:hypothetical protein